MRAQHTHAGEPHRARCQVQRQIYCWSTDLRAGPPNAGNHAGSQGRQPSAAGDLYEGLGPAIGWPALDIKPCTVRRHVCVGGEEKPRSMRCAATDQPRSSSRHLAGRLRAHRGFDEHSRQLDGVSRRRARRRAWAQVGPGRAFRRLTTRAGEAAHSGDGLARWPVGTRWAS